MVMVTAEQIIALSRRHSRWTARQLADELGCSPQAIRSALRRKGVRLTNVRRVRRGDDWERQSILDAYRGGEKLEVIALEFGVTISAITKIARANGEPPRTQPNGAVYGNKHTHS